MAFTLTFDAITSNNIKHIYSGQPARTRLRHSVESPAVAKLKRDKEEVQSNPDEVRTAEYREEYRCYVPKAPAFREVSGDELKGIVERVRRPTKAASWKSEGTDGNTRLLENDTSAPKEKPTDEAVQVIVDRVQKPTKMSLIRNEAVNEYSKNTTKVAH